MRLVDRLDETVSAMSGMLDTLLDINQLEAGIVRREIVDFPINAVLDQLRGAVQPIMRRRTASAGAWSRAASACAAIPACSSR